MLVANDDDADARFDLPIHHRIRKDSQGKRPPPPAHRRAEARTPGQQLSDTFKFTEQTVGDLLPGLVTIEDRGISQILLGQQVQ